MTPEKKNVADILAWCTQFHLLTSTPIPWEALKALAENPSSYLDHVLVKSKHANQELVLAPLDFVVMDLANIHESEVRTQGVAVVKLLVQAGQNPTRFNGIATPVGMAGYSGQLDVLSVFHDHGADLKLELAMEYAGQSGMGRSTLLHRIGLRHQYDRNISPTAAQCLEVGKFLATAAPGSIQMDERGYTVLTDPDVGLAFKQAVAAALASHPSPTPSARPRQP